ncbi:MAG: oxygenase MpaB family protein, partial [Aquabacterium sp.]
MSEPFRKRWGLFPNPGVDRTIAALDARQDCQRIVRLMGQYDMAWDMQRALELALFYTYGSDSVSTLLNRTGEFREHGQKRYDDTRLLIGHFLEAGWDSEAGAQALDRINRTHAHYRIPNEDYLFVLWTFIEFPLRWSKVYARRPMTAHEREAGFNFWVEIGRRMGLSDIPPTRAAFDAFIEGYKQRHFKPCEASAQVAQDTLRVGQAWLPWPLKGLVAPVVYSLFDDDALF